MFTNYLFYLTALTLERGRLIREDLLGLALPEHVPPASVTQAVLHVPIMPMGPAPRSFIVISLEKEPTGLEPGVMNDCGRAMSL